VPLKNKMHKFTNYIVPEMELLTVGPKGQIGDVISRDIKVVLDQETCAVDYGYEFQNCNLNDANYTRVNDFVFNHAPGIISEANWIGNRDFRSQWGEILLSAPNSTHQEAISVQQGPLMWNDLVESTNKALAHVLKTSTPPSIVNHSKGPTRNYNGFGNDISIKIGNLGNSLYPVVTQVNEGDDFIGMYGIK
jgi:hypothetical protein